MKRKNGKSKHFTALRIRLLAYLFFCIFLAHSARKNGYLALNESPSNSPIQKTSFNLISPDQTPFSLIENSPQDEAHYQFFKDISINDFYELIDDSFKPSEALEKRVSFWFDIYAKYGEKDKVVHHIDFPWVVFDVVNTSAIHENLKLHRWTRHHKSIKVVDNRVEEIKDQLLKLSKLRSIHTKNPDEKRWLADLKKLPGDLRGNLKLAAKNLRVQTGQKDAIRAGIQRSLPLIPSIEDIFKKNKVPVELVRLAFLESSFNPEAVSKVGASGIWQIMPSIGKRLLKVNAKVDERNDPIKASYAAAKILRENKMILKQWPLAVSAYNTGPGLIRSGVKSTKSKELNKIIKSFENPNFGFAASNFYAGFVAILHVEFYKDFFFSTAQSANIAANEESSQKISSDTQKL